MKRYDNHESIDELISIEQRTLVRFNSWESPTREAGQQYVIQIVPIDEWWEGITSFDVAFREPDGFVKSIVEVIPKDYHSILRQSAFQIEWTFDLSKALLFDAESIRLINSKGLRVNAINLRLPYSSSRPSGWLGSIGQFPAQQVLDKMLDKAEVKPVFA